MKKSSLLLRQHNPRKVRAKKKFFFFSVCIFLLSVCAVSALYFLVPQIKKSSLFGFKHMIFQPTTHISEQELRQRIRIPKKKNVFDIDLKKLEMQIREHAWVGEIHVARVLPNSIRIEIEEKKPYAILSLEMFYFLDPQGQKIAPVRIGEEAQFPIISGVHIQETEKILESYSLMKEYEKNDFFKSWPLSKIHWDEVYGFVISASFEIRIGKEDFSKRFLRLEKVLKDLSQKSMIPKLVDLNYSKKVVVKIAK